MPVLWTAGVDDRPPDQGGIRRRHLGEHRRASSTSIRARAPSRSGSDADIVVWDPAATKTISAKNQSRAHRLQRVRGLTSAPARRSRRCLAAASRGMDGDLRAKAGDGRYVERPAFPAVHVANSTWREITAPKRVERLEVTP